MAVADARLPAGASPTPSATAMTALSGPVARMPAASSLGPPLSGLLEEKSARLPPPIVNKTSERWSWSKNTRASFRSRVSFTPIRGFPSVGANGSSWDTASI